MEGCRWTIREVADGFGISGGSTNTILTEDLGMQRVAAKFVPKLLSPGQQQLSLEVAQDVLDCASRDPEFLKTVITGSPGMAPCDFWLYPRLKTPLKGSRFDSCEDIIQNATTQLHAITKEAFQNCFQRLKERWAKCVESQGAYFEGG
ncbi:hypothetical protein B7P43_G02463 [Cryptotermes secundus]|uniref:Uncharacterized protein n=1 Tax=Cryptotermes secundus TaxID=105785 RepID=A0A2J7QVD7_9NEOP|nr:hypothetical protein B7P43_G02463 [Cryptotermes secundus]